MAAVVRGMTLKGTGSLAGIRNAVRRQEYFKDAIDYGLMAVDLMVDPDDTSHALLITKWHNLAAARAMAKNMPDQIEVNGAVLEKNGEDRLICDPDNIRADDRVATAEWPCSKENLEDPPA